MIQIELTPLSCLIGLLYSMLVLDLGALLFVAVLAGLGIMVMGPLVKSTLETWLC